MNRGTTQPRAFVHWDQTRSLRRASKIAFFIFKGERTAPNSSRWFARLVFISDTHCVQEAVTIQCVVMCVFSVTKRVVPIDSVCWMKSSASACPELAKQKDCNKTSAANILMSSLLLWHDWIFLRCVWVASIRDKKLPQRKIHVDMYRPLWSPSPSFHEWYHYIGTCKAHAPSFLTKTFW